MRAKPYCKAPWIGLAYESTEGCKPCCEWSGEVFFGTHTDYLKSDYLKDFKELMYEDEMHKGCTECIHNEQKAEAENSWSRRHWFEKFDIEGGLVRLDYRAGNKCNMKCRMCWAGASSLWEEENIAVNGTDLSNFKQQNNDGSNGPTIDTSDVYDIDLSSVSEISILGGEPSIDMKVRNFIDYVTKSKLNDGIEIRITTNASNASKKWFDSLNRIKDLKIMLSVDAAGAIQDYQRSGSDWAKIKKNMIKYRDTFEHVSIHLTATAINFPVLDTWWDELLNLNIPTDFVVVHNPRSQSLNAIPTSYKEDQIKWLEQWRQKMSLGVIFEEMDDKTRDILNEKLSSAKEAIAILTASKYKKWFRAEFKKETLRLDAIRDESIFDLDPRFEEMINER